MVRAFRFLVPFLGIQAFGLAAVLGPIQITADLTDAPRKIVHAHLRIPVQPGPLTLLYPEWIPGEHAPTGPVGNLAGLVFKVNGKTLVWQRDEVEMYNFHLIVPPAAKELEVQLDFLATADTSGFSSGASTTTHLAVLSWNQVLLYPQGLPASQIAFEAAVKLPKDWHFGTALVPATSSDGLTHFAGSSLETLVDSPVLAGEYFKEIALAPDVEPKHFLDIAADDAANLEIKSSALAAYNKLVREAGALFQSRHYGSYHFLLTLSDSVAHFGLEHHESSDDRAEAQMLVDDDIAMVEADLLPHEFSHSWNGKYRRPAGLATRDYQQPMEGKLLWMYEGLTQYMGDLLAERSGLWTPQQYRETLAASAAEQDYLPGRTWRDLEDTGRAAQLLYAGGRAWENWRRSTDFYPEGELLWLDVDMRLRNLSGGRKSLSDFCKAFYGPSGNAKPTVIPYKFEDVVKTLTDVQASDWAPFLRERLQSKGDHTILGGIDSSGYRLEYTQQPNEYITASDARRGGVNAWYSLGLLVGADGSITDVLLGSPAFKAGLGPGMHIIAVNGRRMSDDQLRAAIRGMKDPDASLQLIVDNDGNFRVVTVSYTGGERYPHLVRVTERKDYLDDMLKSATGPN